MLESLRLLTPGPWDAGSCLLSQAADLQVQVTREPQKKPAPSQPLLFGKTFTDHMLMVEWTGKAGWGPPRIQPFQNLTLHPACSALHYSLQVGWLPPGPVRVPPTPQPSLPTLPAQQPPLCFASDWGHLSEGFVPVCPCVSVTFA